MKKIISGILILSFFLAPISAIAQTTSNAVISRYHPSLNIGSGSSYGGGTLNISGVGGAIASCAHIGEFLVNSAASLFGKTNLTKVTGSASSYVGGGQAVSTSDKSTQDKLDTINRTQDCLNGVAYAVAKNTLAQVTQKTLNWVNTGLNGNPLYVQNVGSYLNSIKNQQVKSFLNTVQASNPIFGNALQATITFQTTGLINGRLNIAMNTPQARAYNSFLSDFTNGGWNALLNPAYNPIGALFNASDQLAYNINSQQTQAQNEIQRNNGFEDLKQCVQWSNNGVPTTDNSSPAACSAINNDSDYVRCCTGQKAEDSDACNAYAISDDGGNPQCANITDDTIYKECCNGDSGDSAVCVAYDTYSGKDTTTSQGSIATTNGAALNGTPQCLQYATNTPGSIIANQVASITTTPIRQLEYASKINEVLGSFFDSFVNNLLSKGLRGTSSGKFNGLDLTSSGNNIVTDANGNALDTSQAGENGLGYQSTSVGGTLGNDFDISRPQQLRAILQTQYNFLNRVQDSQIALNRIVPAVGALDYCIPGPNPDWKTGLDGNWQTFVGGIQQADANQPGTVEKIIDSLPGVGSFLGSIVSLFTGSGELPGLWTSNPVLNDKVTGQSIQLNRVLYTPKGHRDDVITSDITNTFGLAYGAATDEYNFYGVPNSNGTFKGTPVGTAFENADPNNKTYVDGFLQDAYVATDSLVGYNQGASTINQTYNQDISDTQSNIEQLNDIMNQVNAIVATAKARYEKAHPEVNTQCLDKAYQIDTTPIVGAARQEPNANNPLQAEEDANVQHSADSGTYFYNNEIK